MSDDDRDDVRREFGEAVTLTPKQLEDWLETDESKEVGQKDGGGEATGHESGRRIVEILRTKEDDLTDDDVAHMRKVVGYVKRHLAQRPDKSDDELAHTRWAASLKNWGHDPLA
ncbi:MAG TPA: DUF3140 domain-containing protein [Mycobacteriales bacterium]|nr:DUF3140 domain-containing protein [Mycobacteriales bacterium]